MQLSGNTEQMLRNCWGEGGGGERKGSNPMMDWHPNWLEVVTSLLHFKNETETVIGCGISQVFQ